MLFSMPLTALLLLEKILELRFRSVDLGGRILGHPVLEGEEGAVVRLLAIRDVLGDVLLALVVRRRIPVLAVLAAVQIDGAVRAGVGPLELHVEGELSLALVAEMPLLLDFRD